MRATRDSGVVWLGGIPGSWEIKPLWTVISFSTGWTPPSNNDDFYSDEFPWVNISDLGPRTVSGTSKALSALAVSTQPLKQTFRGQLMFSFKLSIGQVSFAGMDCYTNEAIASFRESSQLSLLFAFYMLPIVIPQYATENIYGAKMLNARRIKSARIVIPPVKEQKAIADFLGRETAKIDTLIAKQEQLIRTLEERRGVMIREAVTGGIRGNVKMQDTEIPWVGPVCATWKIARLKYLATTGAGAGFPIEEQGVLDEPIAFIKVNSLGRSNSEGIIQEFDDTVSVETAARLGAKVYPPETIVLAKIGAALLLGRIRQLAVESCVDNNMMAVTARMGTSARYLFYVLNLIQFERIVNPGAVPSTSEGAVKNLKFPFPEFPEQIAIANYLDVETRKLDTIVETTREVVSVLQQRRRSLISAAVTGKIKVTS